MPAIKMIFRLFKFAISGLKAYNNNTTTFRRPISSLRWRSLESDETVRAISAFKKSSKETVMNEKIKTNEATQSEEARLRNENYETDAADLKRAQSLEAMRLRDSHKLGFGNETEGSHKAAATALERSQKDNAEALKVAHEEHEARLKRFQNSERKVEDETKQTMAWLTGGYSVHNEEKD
jgi:hypothetical protein